MTAIITRSPLSVLHNPHMMSETRNGRRISARLAEKEDVPTTNGTSAQHTQHPEKTPGRSAKSGKTAGANGAAKVGRPKRKQGYDEESDGFVFTRTRTKKAKVAQEPREEPIPEAQNEPPAPPARKTTRKSRTSTTIDTEEVEAVPKKAGRPLRKSTRNSAGSTNDDPPPLQVKKKRTRSSGEESDGLRGRSKAAQDDQDNVTLQIANSSEVSKIALPFADTPIIRRNKAMRAESGQRRSSLGNRGRRASSLIDSGRSSALPHEEVESSEFYKHIESNIPEPRRMRQLLTWCGTRALGDKPSYKSKDSHERLAAREIQQQLLKDFSIKSELSDWFSREEVDQAQSQALRPNPLNVANLAQIEKLEKQIARLQSERKEWEALLAPSSTPTMPPLSDSDTPHPHTHIDAALLTQPSQTKALQTLQTFFPAPPPHASSQAPSVTLPRTTSLSTSTSTRLNDLTSGLELSIDALATDTHTLSSFQGTVEQVADHILEASARALDLRDEMGKAQEAEQAAAEGSGNGSQSEIRDVLKGLSRVLSQGKS